MSYEIVKSIRYDRKDNKLFIESASNNVRPLSFRRWEVESTDCLLKVLEALMSGDLQLRKTNGTKKISIAFDAVREEEQKRYGMTMNQYAELTAVLNMLDDEFSKKEVTDEWWLEMKEMFEKTDRHNLHEVVRMWWKLRDNGIFSVTDKWVMQSVVKENEIYSLYELFKERVCE